MIFDFLPEDLKKKSEFHKWFLEMEKQIKANYDGRIKHVGDRVIIWDTTGSCNLKGDLYYEREEFFKLEMIVVETNILYQVIVNHLGVKHEFDLDLILFSPSTQNTVRSNSEFCKIINRKNV